jgi:hypothetical protein
MKMHFKKITLGLILGFLFSSCATILGGRIATSQKTKPKRGEEKRQLRVGYFIADIICLAVPLAIDFGTGAIYKPSGGKTSTKAVDK